MKSTPFPELAGEIPACLMFQYYIIDHGRNSRGKALLTRKKRPKEADFRKKDILCILFLQDVL